MKENPQAGQTVCGFCQCIQKTVPARKIVIRILCFALFPTVYCIFQQLVLK